MKTALAFLDLSNMDRSIIAYCKHMVEKTELTHICFLHYIEFQDVTDDYSDYFPELDQPLEKIMEEEILELVDKVGLDRSVISVEVVTHGGQDKLLSWINKSSYDLCIFGKKKKAQGTGVFAGKVARLIDKSVMFATDNLNPEWKHILVPVDFSRFSKNVVQVGNEFASTMNTRLSILHVYRTPPNYFPFMEKANDELLAEVKEESSEELNKFCEKYCQGENVQATLLHAKGQPVANQIYNYAHQHQVDLIMLGVKGKNDDDGLLIGSVAERLIQADKDIPVMLVK